MVENPQYVLEQDFKRVFIPQVLLMFLLGGLLFVGFKFNVVLLDLKLASYVTYIVIAAIVILMAINLFLIYNRTSKENYQFFPNRVEFNGKKKKTIYLKEISGMNLKTNILDKIFNTATIVLEPDFNIKNINNTNQTYFYIQRLIQYSKRRSSYF